MSGETQANVSGWTTDTLHELLLILNETHRRENDDRDRLLTQIMDERRETMTTEFERYRADQKVALDKAMAATDHRFEATNGMRVQLTEQAATFLSRTEYDAAHAALEQRLATIEGRVNTTTGERQGVRMSGGVVAAAITAIASIAVVVNIVVILITH